MPLAKGIARRTVPSTVMGWVRRRRGHGSGLETLSARYCYSVWLRHIVKVAETGQRTDPSAVAELGPGSSLGVGLAAILSGAERYVALDVTPEPVARNSAGLFDELVALFRRREPIPTEFPELRPSLASYAFPSELLTDVRLERSLGPERLKAIRARIARNGFEYVAPWDDPNVIGPESLDLVLSQAVMEHVVDLEKTYAAMFRWLRPGGLISHQIDFGSHGTSRFWNGHWAYPGWLWKVAQGGIINRQPLSVHMRSLSEAGFTLLKIEVEPSQDRRERTAVRPEWGWLTDDDLLSKSAFVLAKRPG